MAKRAYVPYSRRRKKQHGISFLVITIIVAAMVFFAVRVIRKTGDEKPQAGTDSGIAYEIEQPLTETNPVVEQEAEMPRFVQELPKQEISTEVLVVKDDGGKLSVSSVPKVELPETTTNTEKVIDTLRNPQLSSTVSETPSASVDEAQAVSDAIKRATAFVRSGDVIKARELLGATLSRYPNTLQRGAIKDMLSKLSADWLFGDKVLEGDSVCTYYRVQPGDMLSTIGKKYDLPWEFLLKINKMTRAENLRAGQQLKVVQGPFNGIIDKGTFTMDLYLDNLYIKTYRIGIGKEEHDTPTGMWSVTPGGKMISPAWTDPDSGRTYDATDPDYPLGKRWVGLTGLSGEAKGRTGFALHGTNEPESIGQRSSRGCVRFQNDDITEVYDLMTPSSSVVQVVN